MAEFKKVKKQNKFDLGQTVMTSGVAQLVADKGLNLLPYIARHATGDWGDLSGPDQQENDFAVDKYLRILSAYKTPAGKIWIITEADRSVTTVLLPEEY